MEYGIELRPVTPADLPALRRWRNSDAVRLQMQDTGHITPRGQRQWFERIAQSQSQWHRVVWCRGERAGYVNLKGERDAPLSGQAEVDAGLYLGNSRIRHPMLAVAAALAQLDCAFEQLHVERIRTSVRRHNESALRLNLQLGYRVAEQDDEWVSMTLNGAEYQQARGLLRRFFR